MWFRRGQVRANAPSETKRLREEHATPISDISRSAGRDRLQERVNALRWFHQIDFGGGVLAPGPVKIEWLRAQADAYFSVALDGMSVLDIGCWDGFNSFEAARRGARRVLATDHYVWNTPDKGDRQSFELARAHLAPEVEIKDIDLFDLTPATVGTFDIVLFCGIFYHLRNPFLVLEQISKLVEQTLILETHLDAADVDRPAMIFYPSSELSNDDTNWWGPNRACIEAMLRDVGFPRITFRENPAHPSGRGIFHARR
jgi:tRNA (mo5U34)-methyltransferase